MLNPIDLSRIDLNLLVVFETVYTERHVGRSAERLNLTASAVSHGLGRLRQLLNDPLFLRTPKGVTPTERATELAAPIAEALARIRNVIATAAPFDPGGSSRHFTIGAPDAVSAVILPPLLKAVRSTAPGIALSVRQVLAAQEEGAPAQQPWRSSFAALDRRMIDVAIVPTDEVPDRFFKMPLYEEDFVIAMRRGHQHARGLTLETYCQAEHLVVSENADAHGFVDVALAQMARARRTALTVPSFMFALAMLGETDLLGAVPRAFAQRHAATFGVVAVEAPLRLISSQLNAIAPKPAMMDAGVTWLLDQLKASVAPRGLGRMTS